MSTVPKNRPGVLRLEDLPAEERARIAQDDATRALLKIKRLEERNEALERNLQHLADFCPEACRAGEPNNVIASRRI